jgi:nucleoside-diphosphate-sugar epimerase
MRILMIGGTGFIGRVVGAQLRASGHYVATFSRGGDIQGDRRALTQHAGAIRDFAPDVVIDMIVSSGTQARDLMDVVRRVATRVVAISSIDVYRACGVLHRLEEGVLEPVPLTEDSPLRRKLQTYPPQQIETLKSVFEWLDDEYDKIPAERQVLGDSHTAGTVLRLPMVYGPGDRLHRLRALLAHMDTKTDDFVMAESIAQWRGPRGFVDNVAHAVALAATNEAAAGRIYNVAEPQNFSEREWAERVARAIGWSGGIRTVSDADAPPNPLLAGNLAQHWSADSSRIRTELGYAEVVGVDEAIRRSVAWEREHAEPTGEPRLESSTEVKRTGSTMSNR